MHSRNLHYNPGNKDDYPLGCANVLEHESKEEGNIEGNGKRPTKRINDRIYFLEPARDSDKLPLFREGTGVQLICRSTERGEIRGRRKKKRESSRNRGEERVFSQGGSRFWRAVRDKSKPICPGKRAKKRRKRMIRTFL